MSYALKRKALFRRLAVGYLGVLGMIVVALFFSLTQGAGWKPVLTGVPVYLIFFAAITYQFIKELRALKREEESERSSQGDTS
jgi:hypothetical protein